MKTIALILLVAVVFVADGQSDCSEYASDKDVIESYPSLISINPTTDARNVSYAFVDDEGYVVNLTLIRENFPMQSLHCLSRLQALAFEQCSLTEFDPMIAQLSETLVSFSIRQCQGKFVVPNVIFSLTKLINLTLVGCNLESVPDMFDQTKQIINLDLSNNQFAPLPKTLRSLWNLQSLNVSYNPDLISLDVLSGLSANMDLIATNCAIDHLPQSLSRLNSIDLSYNRLTSLDNLTSILSYRMQTMKFKNNLIDTLPEAIGNATTLSVLDLSNNILTTLPKEVYKLDYLSQIYLRGNKFNVKEAEWIKGRFRSKRTIVDI